MHHVFDNFTGSLERSGSKTTEKLLAVQISDLHEYDNLTGLFGMQLRRTR